MNNQKGDCRKFFTSDLQLHFYHKKICEYTNRGMFTDAEHHSEWLIDLINSQAPKGSVVYHLGDMVFSSDPKVVEDFLSKLHCQVFAIKGNHDSQKTWNKVQSNKLIAFKHYEEIKIGGKDACLFHFPIAVWHKQHYGSMMLHGHSHGSFQGQGKCLDVGLDSAYNVFGQHKLFTEDDIIEFMSKREMVVSDHHEVRGDQTKNTDQ